MAALVLKNRFGVRSFLFFRADQFLSLYCHFYSCYFSICTCERYHRSKTCFFKFIIFLKSHFCWRIARCFALQISIFKKHFHFLNHLIINHFIASIIVIEFGWISGWYVASWNHWGLHFWRNFSHAIPNVCETVGGWKCETYGCVEGLPQSPIR